MSDPRPVTLRFPGPDNSTITMTGTIIEGDVEPWVRFIVDEYQARYGEACDARR